MKDQPPRASTAPLALWRACWACCWDFCFKYILEVNKYKYLQGSVLASEGAPDNAQEARKEPVNSKSVEQEKGLSLVIKLGDA